MITAWRIVKQRYAAAAFDGEAARLFGGRWNSPGVAVVYVASSRSLAVLETAVHLDRSTLLSAFVLIPCEFDERLVTIVPQHTLPVAWRRNPPRPTVAEVGDSWVKAARTAILQVPSAIIEPERNYLLNPAYPDFAQIKVGEPETFEFDPRLISCSSADVRPACSSPIRQPEVSVRPRMSTPSWT